MVEELLDRAWTQMAQAGELSKEEKDIYIFGLRQGAMFILNLCTALFIGFFLNMLFEIITYLTCFIPLRVFAGGYHAKTQLRCYIMSRICSVAVLILIRLLSQQDNLIGIICFGISFIIIWKLSPVADANKPLTLNEQIIYRNKVRRILIGLLVIASLSIVSEYKIVADVITVVLCFLSAIMLAGFYKNLKTYEEIEKLVR